VAVLAGLARTSVGHEIGAAAYGRGCAGLCAALRRAGHLCLGTVKERTAAVERYRESRADGGQGSDARQGVGAGLGGDLILQLRAKMLEEVAPTREREFLFGDEAAILELFVAKRIADQK
jgi:hypothetical protein